MIFIYTLLDPRSFEERYVGQTDNPPMRLRNHLNRKTSTHCANWIRKLRRENLKPVMEIINIVETDRGNDVEISAIAFYRAAGARLTNCTPGGEGLRGARFSDEHRRRIALAHMGRKFSPEHRAKLAAASKGNRHAAGRIQPSKERAMRSAKLMGRPCSDATRKKMSAARMGWNPSPETRAKMSANARRRGAPKATEAMIESLRQRNKSPEMRAKVSAAHTGKKVSIHTREKLSAIATEWWRKRKQVNG